VLYEYDTVLRLAVVQLQRALLRLGLALALGLSQTPGPGPEIGPNEYFDRDPWS